MSRKCKSCPSLTFPCQAENHGKFFFVVQETQIHLSLPDLQQWLFRCLMLIRCLSLLRHKYAAADAVAADSGVLLRDDGEGRGRRRCRLIRKGLKGRERDEEMREREGERDV